MSTRMTIDQLEQMRTHELADLLANVVLLLRRMPDVEWKQLTQQVPSNESLATPNVQQVATATASLTREELAKKKVADLKTLAKELNVFFSSPIKKDDLIAKILAKSADGRSEQRAIQDM